MSEAQRAHIGKRAVHWITRIWQAPCDEVHASNHSGWAASPAQRAGEWWVLAGEENKAEVDFHLSVQSQKSKRFTYSSL